MMDMWISFGDGFLLLFAINDIESFEALKGKYNRIMKQKHNEKVPVVLVGNKIDLENERRVLYQEAKELANSWGAEYFRKLDSAIEKICITKFKNNINRK